jgi:DNA-binding response OmpR family regulator
MPGPLDGRVVLIVQRSWTIASALADALEANGAQVLVAKNSSSDRALADDPRLSAAVLDGQSNDVRRRLEARRLPFLVYAGHAQDESATLTIIRKPASLAEVVARVEQLLSRP